jgi:translation initiation factor 2-alpha kinase 1
MLLASLIEHFCRTYGDTPDANRKVFFLICQTLRSLGIIDAEFVDEMTSVRSSFQQAFHKLFYTAVQTVRNQDLMCFDDNIPRLIKPTKEEEEEEFSTTSSISSESDEEEKLAVKARPTKKKNNAKQEIDYISSSQNSSSATAGLNVSSPGDIASKLSSSANTLHSFMNNSNPNGAGGDFFHNLRVQNSRYDNDFVEMVLLGKGGFASAFRARNKLDGIDYAVKKIRLGTDIESGSSLSDSQNPYEKIFREIKNLARLEHINVIRYYSSWLEYDDSDHPLDESEWEGDYSVSINASCKRLAGARKNSFYSTGEESSVFDGRDPTFTDDDEESSLGIYPQQPSESGMSHIQFGNDNSSSGGAGAYNGGDSTSSMSYSKSSSFNNKKRGAGAAITQQSGWTLFIQMQLCPSK